MGLPALRATAGIAATLSVLAMACACVSAQAASYTVWSCRGPDGKPLSSEAWRAGDSRGAATQDTCAEGGALRARLQSSGEEPGLVHGFRFALPADATITGYRVQLFAQTAKALLEDAYQAGLDDDAGLTVGAFDAGCPTSGCVFGNPDEPLDAKNLVEAGELESPGLVVGVRCGALLGCFQFEEPDGGEQEGGEQENTLAEVRMFRSQVDLRDDEAPLLGEPSGSLVAGETLTGAAASVTFAAQDGGGGVASLALLVDGAEVARRDVGGACAEPYTEPEPCPSSYSATLTADLSALADGEHTATLRATDAAGNATSGTPITFTVGPAPDPPNPPGTPGTPGSPVAPGTQTVIVEKLVPASSPKPVTIEVARERVDLWREDPVVSGVVKEAGNPLPGAKVIVRSRPFGVRRSKRRTERTLTTDGAGRFSMPAGVVSRLLELDVDDAAHRARDQVEVELLNRLRIAAAAPGRPLRNGSIMRLRADIRGAGSGTLGKVVLMQAVVGGRWTTVASLTADDDGRAVWRYRFRGTTRSAIYRFRVQVERAGDVWPWPTTTSEVLRVAVRP